MANKKTKTKKVKLIKKDKARELEQKVSYIIDSVVSLNIYVRTNIQYQNKIISEQKDLIEKFLNQSAGFKENAEALSCKIEKYKKVEVDIIDKVNLHKLVNNVKNTSTLLSKIVELIKPMNSEKINYLSKLFDMSTEQRDAILKITNALGK